MDAVLDGEAREEAVRRAHRRVPEPVVRGERAVVRPQLLQPRGEHGEVPAFVLCDAGEVVEEFEGMRSCPPKRATMSQERSAAQLSVCASECSSASRLCALPPFPSFGAREGGSSRTASLRAGRSGGARGGWDGS